MADDVAALRDFGQERLMRLAPDRLRGRRDGRQARSGDELVANQPRHRLPKKITVPAQAQQRSLDAAQARQNSGVRTARASPVEPGFEGFDEDFRARAAGISRNVFKPAGQRLGKE